MRYLDEKVMWYAETEELSYKLENKSAREIQQILDKNDVIKLRSTKRPKTTMFNRVMFVMLFLPIMLLCSTKWCITGDFYLDSWEKKSRVLTFILNLMGRNK